MVHMGDAVARSCGCRVMRRMRSLIGVFGVFGVFRVQVRGNQQQQGCARRRGADDAALLRPVACADRPGRAQADGALLQGR